MLSPMSPVAPEMSGSLIIQQPTGAADQLIVLFHGIGASAQHMVPLDQRLAEEFPNAFVVSVDGPQASDLSAGRQWFSVHGITEENRAIRVEAAMPGFQATVRHRQGVAKVGVEGTALIGFSQGAIMALESTRRRDPPAGRVVSIAGLFAQLPEQAARHTTLHLLHGKADPVIPYAHAIAAAERLVALGGDVTADVIPFVGHEINPEIEALLVERLKGYLPRRHWEEALRADGGRMPDRVSAA